MDERTKAIVSAAVVLFVNIMALCGASLDMGMVQNVAIGAVSIATTIYAVWKNHNFTPQAAAAQEYLNMLKDKPNNVSTNEPSNEE